MSSRIHRIHGIIPPYMLERIAQQGSPIQRERAQRALALSTTMRTRREAFQAPPEAAALSTQLERTVYSAENGSNLPGRRVRGEGEPPSGDAAVDEAYDGAGATYNLYHDAYGRNSIDNNGMPLISTVHYERNYDNAFWNGDQMVYGDGDEDLPPDQRLFNRFTIAVDVIGHELTHGVTQHTAKLIYSGQSGALNESISDVFGSLVKQYVRQQTVNMADWLIGEGLFTSNVHGVALRSMKAPGTAYDDPVLGKDPQPANMKDYVQTTSDNGGVHINSGIPNRAFYMVAKEIGGFAWERAGKIWYITLRDKLQPSATFQDAADLTYQTAGELYGEGSKEQLAVRHGWQAVGIEVGAKPKPKSWVQILLDWLISLFGKR